MLIFIFTSCQAPVTVAFPFVEDETILMVTATGHTLPIEICQKAILVGLGVWVIFLSHNVATNLHVINIITFPFERN